MEWNSLNVGSVEVELDLPREEETKGFYCAADSPGCSNRGKYKREVRACWDTMKYLQYINGNLTDNNGAFFEILHCIKCGDFYLDECPENSFVEKEFTCFECNTKGNDE
jgi:hypothetical protein